MAKASPFNVTFPEFKAPEFKLPKFDVDAAVRPADGQSRRRARGAEHRPRGRPGDRQDPAWLGPGDRGRRCRRCWPARQPKEPQALLADVKAAAEKAVAAGKQGMDLGVAAQQRVAELVAKRVQANIDEFKALAA